MKARAVALAAAVVAAMAGAAWMASDAPSAAARSGTSPWSSAVVWVAEQQRLLHRELADHLRRLQVDGGGIAAWGLIVAGFTYGIVHAVGPGHGKAILTTYLLTQRERLSHGVFLATVAAYCQGAVAIALLYGLTRIAGWLPRETSVAVTWSERISFALIVVLGAWLAVQAVRRLFTLAKPTMGHDHAHCDHDGHRYGPTDGLRAAGHCGHDHGPSADQIGRAHDLRSSLGVIASIGFRPCSGAILVLALANAFGMPWIGVAAVAAMSTGTAAATTALAILAVQARAWAARFAQGRLSVATETVVVNGVAFVGGIVILLFGGVMFAASLAPPHPLGL